jgi:hypothetical protein
MTLNLNAGSYSIIIYFTPNDIINNNKVSIITNLVILNANIPININIGKQLSYTKMSFTNTIPEF